MTNTYHTKKIHSLALSIRLTEGVDQKNPVMCSFSRVAIVMKKIFFQDARSDLGVKINLLPFGTARQERVENPEPRDGQVVFL